FENAINRSDLFVVSLKQEGVGLAVPSKTYSYYMGGKPIIAIIDKNTDIAREIEQYDAGFIIDYGNSERLNKVINDLLSDTKLLEKMGNNSRKIYLDKYT